MLLFFFGVLVFLAILFLQALIEYKKLNSLILKDNYNLSFFELKKINGGYYA